MMKINFVGYRNVENVIIDLDFLYRIIIRLNVMDFVISMYIYKV